MDPMRAVYEISMGENATYNMQTKEYTIDGVTYNENMQMVAINGVRIDYDKMKIDMEKSQNVQRTASDFQMNPAMAKKARANLGQQQPRRVETQQPQYESNTSVEYYEDALSGLLTEEEKGQKVSQNSFRDSLNVRNSNSDYYVKDYDKKVEKAQKESKEKESSKTQNEYDKALEGLL